MDLSWADMKYKKEAKDAYWSPCVCQKMVIIRDNSNTMNMKLEYTIQSETEKQHIDFALKSIVIMNVTHIGIAEYSIVSISCSVLSTAQHAHHPQYPGHNGGAYLQILLKL